MSQRISSFPGSARQWHKASLQQRQSRSRESRPVDRDGTVNNRRRTVLTSRLALTSFWLPDTTPPAPDLHVREIYSKSIEPSTLVSEMVDAGREHKKTWWPVNTTTPQLHCSVIASSVLEVAMVVSFFVRKPLSFSTRVQVTQTHRSSL